VTDLLRILADDWQPEPGLLPELQALLTVQEPTALARSTALWAWKRLWEAEHPAARNGGDRKSPAYKAKNQTEKISFCSAAAERLGLSERAVRLDVQLAEDLGAPDIRQLWTSPIADNAAALRAVARFSTAERGWLFSVWRTSPALPFRRALVEARLRAEADSDEAKFLNLIKAWERAGGKVRRRFLAAIGIPHPLGRPAEPASPGTGEAMTLTPINGTEHGEAARQRSASQEDAEAA